MRLFPPRRLPREVPALLSALVVHHGAGADSSDIGGLRRMALVYPAQDRKRGRAVRRPLLATFSRMRMTACAMTLVVAVGYAGGCKSTTSATGPRVVARVVITPDTASMFAGQAVQLSATAFDSAGRAIDNATITWQSSQPARADVASGKVQSIIAGRVRISAQSGSASDTAVIAITPNPIDFESFPDGSPMCADLCTVSTQFAARGVAILFYRPYPIGLLATINRIGSANGLTTHVLTTANDNGVFYGGRILLDFPAQPDTVVLTLYGGVNPAPLVATPSATLQTLSSSVVDFGITGMLQKYVVRMVSAGGIQRIQVGDTTANYLNSPMIDDLTIGPL